MGAIKFSGINHLAMATADMDMTIEFWRDLLGMRLVAGLGHEGYRHYFFEISEHDMIAFFEWPDVQPIEEKDHGVPVHGPAVFDHISFGIEDQDSLWELRNKLEAAGFWGSEVVDHGFIHSVYGFDPNGIPIEFSWNVPQHNVHLHPRMVDQHPTPGALEGTEPVPGKWDQPENVVSDEDKVVYPGEGEEFLEKKNHWE